MISRRMLGSKDTVPPSAFTVSTADSATSMARSENSDEPMTWTWSASASSFARGRADLDQAGGAVADVEDEMPAGVGPVGDEGRAGGVPLVNRDRRHVGAQRPQPLDVQPAEIVVADGADEAGRLAECRRLADEDGGRAGRVGPKQRTRLEKALADPLGHDLDEDLAGADQLLHLAELLPTFRPRSDSAWRQPISEVNTACIFRVN